MILDQSTSMGSIVDKTIEGFNGFLSEQKVQPGECEFSLRLFDSTTKEVVKNKPITEVDLLTKETYRPYGNTALYDAIGLSIDELGHHLSSLPEEERPNKVLVAILTDGEENSSTKYTAKKVSEMIKHQKDVYNWDFMFLASNQDALEVANNISIPKGNSMSFKSASLGNIGLKKLSATLSSYRSNSFVTRDEIFADAGMDNKEVE
jgi:uncharacterized protein YegL